MSYLILEWVKFEQLSIELFTFWQTDRDPFVGQHFNVGVSCFSCHSSIWDHISHLNAVRWTRMDIFGRMFPHLKQIKLSCTPLNVTTAALPDLMCHLCLQLPLSPSRATYEGSSDHWRGHTWKRLWTNLLSFSVVLKPSQGSAGKVPSCPLGRVSVRWGLRGSGKGERLGKVKVLSEVLNLKAGGGDVRLCCPSGTGGMRTCICTCAKRI